MWHLAHWDSEPVICVVPLTPRPCCGIRSPAGGPHRAYPPLSLSLRRKKELRARMEARVDSAGVTSFLEML